MVSDGLVPTFQTLPEVQSKEEKKKKEEKKVISIPLVMVAVLDGFQKDLSRRTWVIGICS